MLELKNTEIKQKLIELYMYEEAKLFYQEIIGICLLDINNYKGDLIRDVQAQARYGDVYIDENDNHYHFIDLKSCYINSYSNSYIFNRNTLAIDLEYFKCDDKGNLLFDSEGEMLPYIQSNTDNNLGWLYHLDKCDTLLCVDTDSRDIFVLENFQKLREFIIDLDLEDKLKDYLDNENKRAYDLQISRDWNKSKTRVIKRTRTLYLNLNNTKFLNSIGCSIHSYKYKVI